MSTFNAWITTADYASGSRDGLKLGQVFSLLQFSFNGLHIFVESSSQHAAEYRIGQFRDKSFREPLLNFWKTCSILYSKRNLEETFTQHQALVQSVLRGFSTWPAAFLPILFNVCRDSLNLASKCNKIAKLSNTSSEHIEIAARTLNRAFTTCTTDRAPLANSRKWGAYYIIGLLFKAYFKLDNLSLSANIVKAAQVSELPDISFFPKSHIVTYRYYMGIIAFLNEDYTKACEELEEAFKLCSKKETRNPEIILTYLIPSALIGQQKSPSDEIFSKYPLIADRYQQFCRSLRQGNIQEYDQALLKNQVLFIRQRVYVTLEKGRSLCLRNLIRKVWKFRGGGTRMPLEDFRLALSCAGFEVKSDEAECCVANMIYRVS